MLNLVGSAFPCEGGEVCPELTTGTKRGLVFFGNTLDGNIQDESAYFAKPVNRASAGFALAGIA
jgi:hypothetical protein